MLAFLDPGFHLGQVPYSWIDPNVSGVAVNKTWRKDAEAFKAVLTQNVTTQYHPIGCDTIRSTVDHELGHQLDGLLGLSADADVISAYNQAVRTDIKSEVSTCAGESIGEFIAECWAESLNNPTPRAFAKKISSIVRERYGAKHPK